MTFLSSGYSSIDPISAPVYFTNFFSNFVSNLPSYLNSKFVLRYGPLGGTIFIFADASDLKLG